ncbi:site-specific integrase [Clostridium botulinum C]|uniref:Site-specific integrase n=2 Tax=Clostridium botulinum TaxID=1491 RepID=A0A9Q4XVB9_CLOBO|nr:tyrosine-type recombinase/integrase [Clostridium botulinum]MCD3196111.1 site-specific integrase [Clostridium botulinum C]MCD3201461.1 site-specific integrase [Clostridium botulinum C]MCD3206967.1 site-specific integrase [Clostridium botulinum C]MCD3209045.1 site-specific integrase [Clostridium botulinum C]MCD3225541.1 site-specific integrase [Clostridium botulinum C]
MKGGVRKRGDTWYYYFDLGKIDGKRKKIERKGGRTKKAALEALNEAMIKYKHGFVEPKKMSINEYLTDWLENYIKENRKINTYNRYNQIFKNNIKPYISTVLLEDLKPIHIDNLLLQEKKKGLSGSTLQTIYGVLNSSFNRAVKLQIMYENPCKFIDRPKRDRFIANILSVDEINKIFNLLNTDIYHDYIMFLALKIILELGLRRGELGGLEWKDIDFKNKCINIKNNLIYTDNDVRISTPKTEDSERVLTISDNLITLLKLHKKIQNSNKLKYGEFYEENFFNSRKYNFIMTWENGKFVHPNYYTKNFKKIINKLDLKKNIRFHDLRHTNATLLLQQGIDFKVIQIRLGHSDINTTLNIYSHVTLDMQKSATDKITALLN